MCTAIALAAGSAAVSTVGGVMQAKAQHRAAQEAAARQNLINDLNYKKQLQISKIKDQEKGEAFSRQLAANAAARTTLYRQMALNNMERVRASIAAQQALKEKITESSFESQQALADRIKATGTLLASSQSGQSMLLSLMNAERELGFKDAQVNAALTDASTAYRFSEFGFDLDKYAADQSALARLPGTPVAQRASLRTIRMPEVSGPSGLSYTANIIGAIGGGLSAGTSAYSAAKDAGLPTGHGTPTS